MMYEIHLSQECANVIGLGTVVTVGTLAVNDGFITVGSYNIPLSNILLVKEV